VNDYNGFSGAQRLRALAWVRPQYADGTRERAKICDACGQTDGVLDRHSEDYSEPFGDHIGAYGLCYTCHMMVHCRFRSPKAWNLYKEAVAAGATFPAVLTRNFHRIANTFLCGLPPTPTWRADPPGRLVLEEIDSGQGLRRTA
jgi:hypothetical protein